MKISILNALQNVFYVEIYAVVKNLQFGFD